MVINSFSVAWQGWQLQRVRGDVFTLDTKAKGLVWHFTTSFTDFRVLPKHAISPASAVAAGERNFFGLQYKLGPAQGLLQWHAEHGFPCVPEAAMRKLYGTELKIQAPDDTQSADVLVNLKLCAMSHLAPEMSQHQAVVAIGKAHAKEDRSCTCQVELDDDMLRDVVNPKEHKEINDFKTEVKTAKLAKQVAVAAAEKAVATYIKKKGKPGTLAKQALPIWKAVAHESTDKATAYLKRHLPPPARLVQHAKHGAWEVGFPGYQRRSFSWTARGHTKTIAMVLHWAWSLQKEENQEVPGWSLDQMEKVAMT